MSESIKEEADNEEKTEAINSGRGQNQKPPHTHTHTNTHSDMEASAAPSSDFTHLPSHLEVKPSLPEQTYSQTHPCPLITLLIVCRLVHYRKKYLIYWMDCH